MRGRRQLTRLPLASFLPSPFELGVNPCEVIEDDTRRVAIEDVERGTRENFMQIEEVERDVVRVILVKNPYLALLSWLWHTMAVIMEEHSLVLCCATQICAHTFKIDDGWIRGDFVLCFQLPSFILGLQSMCNAFDRICGGQSFGIDPSFENSARLRFCGGWRVTSDVETEDEHAMGGAHTVANTPEVRDVLAW